MRFYFNIDLNYCAEEPWVVDYLTHTKEYDSKEEALEALENDREAGGWFACRVTKAMNKAMKENDI